MTIDELNEKYNLALQLNHDGTQPHALFTVGFVEQVKRQWPQIYAVLKAAEDWEFNGARLANRFLHRFLHYSMRGSFNLKNSDRLLQKYYFCSEECNCCASCSHSCEQDI